jgi:hypothetical protein
VGEATIRKSIIAKKADVNGFIALEALTISKLLISPNSSDADTTKVVFDLQSCYSFLQDLSKQSDTNHSRFASSPAQETE